MKTVEVTHVIIQLAQDQHLHFLAKARSVENALEKCSAAEFLEHLDYAGVIPECFEHDSTEEKLFAKYCDALLAKAWRELGLDAHVITERSGAADVLAEGEGYTIVGDAKAFRLSRTAKNQKDFKVEALAQWRKNADYACLVCPLYQYPGKKSQIYAQAIRYRVTLLTYTHLAFLVRHGIENPGLLKPLWELTTALGEDESADPYWQAVEKTVLKLTNKQNADWKQSVRDTYARLSLKAKEQLSFWEGEKQRLKTLTHDLAIEELIKALKIDNKIAVIRRTGGI